MKSNNTLLLIKGSDVGKILKDKEKQIIDVVKKAYTAFSEQKSSLPHSIFLRFPNNTSNRIIGLPAYDGSEVPTAGIKWVASFPNNIGQGIERASASIILNATDTGRPYAFLEGSIISAKRTAASAALATQVLNRGKKYTSMALIGCGLINFEIFKFTTNVHENIKNVFIYDLDQSRAEQFVIKIKSIGSYNVTICKSLEEATKSSLLIAFATTASTPHINDNTIFQSNSLILHISLRDLGINIITKNINIVDDVDHVNRENTSIYLASQKTKNTNFVLTNIGEVLLKKASPPQSGIIIFSPFGLGVLDMALARYVYTTAQKQDKGSVISDFVPDPWTVR